MTADATRHWLASPPPSGAATPAALIGASDHDARIAAAQTAGAHAFIAELPEGYHTPIGKGGVVLTASQRRRLHVAALIAADPNASLSREATAMLDPRVPDARQDPALPWLPRLLDAREMAPLLGQMLFTGTDREGTDAEVRVQSVRYKPGDNAVVQYAVLTSLGWATAVAYTRAGARLHRKRKDPVNRELARRVADRTPASEALAYLPGLHALVQWLPLDVRLPVLADPAERLAERLAKKGIDAAGAQPQLLRYSPRRRAVLRLGNHILKVYRDRADFDHALCGLRVSAALTRVHTPAYEGRLKARQVTIQEWVPGHPPSMWPGSSGAAGVLLAELHGETVAHLSTMSPQDILAKATRCADLITHLVPEVRPEVSALLADLMQRLPQDTVMTTSHGNFHAGQLLSASTGLTMLDVDRMCRAAPAYDLASFASHLVFGRPGDPEVLNAAVDSLIAGYGHRPEGLDWYLSACLLRRAAVPFRFRDEHWPVAVSTLVGLARQVLR